MEMMIFNMNKVCRMVNGLLKTAQGISPGAESSLTPAQDGDLKLAAIKCLVGVLRSMGNWMNHQLRLSDSSPYLKSNDVEESRSEASATMPGAGIGSEAREDNAEASGSESHPSEETSEVATFEQRRAHKLEVQVVTICKLNIIKYFGGEGACMYSNSNQDCNCRKVYHCSIRSLAKVLSS